MKSIKIAFTLLLAIASVTTMAEEQCTLSKMNAQITTEMADDTRAERLGELQGAIADFLEQNERNASPLALQNAVELVEFLRDRGFFEVEIQVIDTSTSRRSRKAPGIAATGAVTFAGVGALTALFMLVISGDDLAAGYVGVVVGGIAAGVTVVNALLDEDWRGEEGSFFCELALRG